MTSIGLAAAVAAAVVLLIGPILIPVLVKFHCGQSIRGEGPTSHQKKSGTPTMGGLMLLAAIMLGTLAADGLEPSVLLALFVTIGYGAIGFLDDYIKVVKKRNLGLRAREKLAGQIVLAAVVAVVGSRFLGLTTELWVPFLPEPVACGALYYLLLFFVFVGTTNAVNLTDGLDGLATGTVAIAMGAYVIVCLSLGKAALSAFCAATAAAAVAFLRFNAHPARVFMGDTGSLALGGALAAVAVLTKTELLLVLIGGVFVAEALSVILQVISFQTTGRRIFRMSPLHHHFELGGWPETKVVHAFWLAGAACSLLALWLGKVG